MKRGEPVQARSADERREAILDVAAKLFAARDRAVVTMEEIAAGAGVAKGTLYNHFSSKDDLYISILTGRMRNLLSALDLAFRSDEDPRLRLRKFVVHTLMFFVKYPDFFTMMRKEAAAACGSRRETGGRRDDPEPIGSLRGRLRDLLRGVLQSGIAAGSIRSLPPDLAADAVLGIVEGAAVRRLRRAPSQRAAAEENDLVFDLVWRSVSAPPAGAGGSPRVRVVITREEAPGEGLGAEIERRGGVPVHIPLVRTAPAPDADALERAAAEAAGYDWILFTSARGVSAFREARDRARRGPLPASVRLGAVGEGTAEGLRAAFGRVDLVAAEASGEGLARSLCGSRDVAGLRILLPRAGESRSDLPSILEAAGARVDDVVAYRTVPVAGGTGALERLLGDGEGAVVTLASGSAARALLDGDGSHWLSRLRPRVRLVSIGPSTTAVVRSLGADVDGEASRPGLAELAEAALRAAEADGDGRATAAGPVEARGRKARPATEKGVRSS